MNKPMRFSWPLHKDLASTLPFSFNSCAPALDAWARVDISRASPRVVYEHGKVAEGFKPIFLPTDPTVWPESCVHYATPQDLERIKASGLPIEKVEYECREYYYKTETFLNTKGTFGKHVRQFAKAHPTYEVRESMPREAILELYERWFVEVQKKPKQSYTDDGLADDRSLFMRCLENLEAYGIRQVYVLVEGKLVGLAWGVLHSPGRWVGLHLKADHEYKEITRFLQHERAKRFMDTEEVTLSTGAGEKGLDRIKQMYGPSRTEDYYTVWIGTSLTKPQVPCSIPFANTAVHADLRSESQRKAKVSQLL